VDDLDFQRALAIAEAPDPTDHPASVLRDKGEHGVLVSGQRFFVAVCCPQQHTEFKSHA